LSKNLYVPAERSTPDDSKPPGGQREVLLDEKHRDDIDL
jgi:hypothetical protein